MSEFFKRINVEKENLEPVDLNKILRKMLSNYVNILLKERLADKFELLCCLNTEGRFNYICPNHYKVMGFESDELLGVNGIEIIHPDDMEKMENLLFEMLQTKQPTEMVYRIKHKNGNWLTMHSICTPYIIDGEVVTLVNFSNSI